MSKSRKNKAFTLVEVIVASALSSITLTCIIQFFLTQLNQYRLISANNKLTENLRTFSKFFEKDVHNSLEFCTFENLDEALDFRNTTTKAGISWTGNCILFIQERGRVKGGRGVIYFVDDKITKNGQDCYPLYRALVSFNEKKLVEKKEDLQCLLMGYLKSNDKGNSFYRHFSQTQNTPWGDVNYSGIFYVFDKTEYPDSTGGQHHYVEGTRRSVYVGLVFIQPGLHGVASETSVNFCFYSRNPKPWKVIFGEKDF